MEKFKNNKEMNKKKDIKDSADDFIQGKNERIHLNNSTKVSDQSEYLKKKFIARKKKLSSFIPKVKVKSKDHFYKLGAFKTNIGKISVGFERFRGKPKFRFTLISSLEDDYDDKYSNKRFDDEHNFFKKKYEGKEKYYKENKTTVEFDPIEKNLSKVNEDHTDMKIEDDDEMLYDDTSEESELKSLRNSQKFSNFVEVNDAIGDIKKIQNEKKEDNLEFERDLKKFISDFMNNKLKKFYDSDQLQRAKILISKNDFIIIKKRMEEIMKLRKMLYMVIKLIIEKKKGVE